MSYDDLIPTIEAPDKRTPLPRHMVVSLTVKAIKDNPDIAYGASIGDKHKYYILQDIVLSKCNGRTSKQVIDQILSKYLDNS